MPISREFLGWDAALLPRCVTWLHQRFGRGDRLDLSRVLIVLPGARAGRRLLELLSDRPGVLIPPKIITLGSLPEHLDSPASVAAESTSPRVADQLTCLLARMHSLRGASNDVLSRLIPKPPEEGDLSAWLALTRELSALHETLSGEGVRFEDVIASAGDLLQPSEQDRWLSLATLNEQYEQALVSRRLADPHQARAAAIAAGRCRYAGHVILVACTDVNRVTRRMLAQVEERVTALIFAPPDEAAAFDDFGCVVVDHWCERAIDVRQEQIQVVDRPRDQAYAALCEIVPQRAEPATQKATATGSVRSRSKRGSDGTLPLLAVVGAEAEPAPMPALDDITIGLGDESLGPLVQRTLELAGLPAHLPVGKPVAQSRPALLLAGLAEFAGRLRLDDFAAVLRHPDLERHLRRVLSTANRQVQGHGEGQELDSAQADDARFSNPAQPPGGAIQSWLTLLDEYVGEHLSGRTVGRWLGVPARAEQLKAVHDAVMALLPEEREVRRPLPAWSQPIAALLRTIYEPLPLDRRAPADNELLRALGAIGDSLRSQAKLDPADALTPLLAFADAVNLTLELLRDQQTPPAVAPQGAAVELLGWLELPLDDAPHLVIAGFNEHHIPQSSTSDAFIPDSLRRKLGLIDNRRRQARDAASLTAILHSRPDATLIAGRRGNDDEPLKPSRLLLTLEGAALARRVQAFYPDDPARQCTIAAPLLLPAGDENRFTIPLPIPLKAPISRLRVTAFRDYLNCPFRFYLKHVLKLREVDDRAVELDGLQFGNLAHHVLESFAGSEVSDAMDPGKIASFLAASLDHHARLMLGSEPLAAAQIQIEQLRERLTSFAAWQAGHAAEGWRIVPSLTEKKLECVIDVGGSGVTVHGRIDRIDRCNDKWLIIDYKTGDQGQTPEQTHRVKGEPHPQWVDLQLPLYRRLAESLKIPGDAGLGYVLLPKKLDEVGLAQADWDEGDLKEADRAIENVIAGIRAGVFWPPREPLSSRDVDEYSALCLDAYQGRPQVIQAINQALKQGRDAAGRVTP